MDDLLSVCDTLTFSDENGQGFELPFLGRGNVWIKNDYSLSIVQLVRSVLFSALANTATGQLTIIGYDSDLSGVFAPFAKLSQGESRQFTILNDRQELTRKISDLKQGIRDVQAVIQGRYRSLYDFRKNTGRPIEGYRLVVLSLDMGQAPQALREDLKLIFRSGPAAGISILLISPDDITMNSKSGDEVKMPWRYFAPHTEMVSCQNGYVLHFITPERYELSPIPEVTPNQIIQYCDNYITTACNQKMPTVNMNEIQDFSRLWDHTSIDGLTCTIGMYGVNPMSITIGDEVNQRHNAVITGAVGQGKSNLISVVVHSLCQRYSPDELELYMLDFKEGVSLKPYAPIDQEEYLPHAKALGLESDVSFGIAVLKELFGIYQRRMATLKRYNVRSIREYRLKYPDRRMPRILVIIDEFQMLFEGSRETADDAANLLEKSVRLFRAAGIHFILASQTLSGNVAFMQHRDNIFSQIPIRIALKNSVGESQQTLSASNTQAAYLRPREAIVNLDYGELSQNQKTVVAFADERLLAPARHEWWMQAKDTHHPPYVFERNRKISVVSAMSNIQSRKKRESRPLAFLGQYISVSGSNVAIPLPDEPGRNIAILGTPDHDCNNALGMLQGAALSLALQDHARFLFCDFSNKERPISETAQEFVQAMEEAGSPVENIDAGNFTQTLKDLLAEPSEGETYLFAASLDRWDYQADPFQQGNPLKALVDRGPAQGVHFIGWWNKSVAFMRQIAGMGDSTAAFNTKVFLRIDQRSVQSLTNPFVRWTPQQDRALIADDVELTREHTFVPFAPIAKTDVTELGKALQLLEQSHT